MPIELSDRDHEVFEARGVLHLPRCVPTSRTNAGKDAVVAELTRLGARAGGKWHEAKFPPKLRHLAAFDDVIPSALVTCVEALARATLVGLPQPQFLLTPPQGPAWVVPYLGWHLDVASPSRDVLPGVQVFVLIDEVAPRGGGTVAIAGSHKLHSPKGGVAVSAHRALQADPVYAGLFSAETKDRQKFLAPQVVNGVTVQVVEMCGKAGDVYLMDMRTVHAAAANTTKRPRMMLTNRYLSPRGGHAG